MCDKIYHMFSEPEADTNMGDEYLEDWCNRAQRPGADAMLKQSVFGLMKPEEIKHFLLAPDNKLWHKIIRTTEHFLERLENHNENPTWEPHEMTAPRPHNDCIAKLNPVVMDHTVREPATNTPFGHTGYLKYLSLKIVQFMGMKDIAIAGLYYKDSYTPETQILEELQDRGESMDGLIVMFGPGTGDRKAGIKAIKEFGVPNAFLDLTLKASIRFAQEDFKTSVLDAVHELDEVLTAQLGKKEPYRTQEDKGMGEISLNLVDLMEFVKLETNGSMDPEKKKQVEETFASWLKDEAFRRRVVAILTEEGRGCANYLDYGVLVEWLRRQFPDCRLLVHAHAGPSNSQDSASVQAVLKGANGVWAAVIPQAAQGGHNSSFVFLDSMARLGCAYVWEKYWLHQGLQCARHVFYLNFNTFNVPEDCPIWGNRVGQLTHSAFSTTSGEEWRKEAGKYYNVWALEDQVEFGKSQKVPEQKEADEVRVRNRSNGNYRISPLVSDVDTWMHRLKELNIFKGWVYRDRVARMRARLRVLVCFLHS